ncbi:PEGA domain-containing protein [Lujinxingia vulgaris]|uniref:PEGA domain-containing protein n=2 Tax=Lujinxingia vulgaris TaxID=2600176 RepID=A0A5C6XCA3_9DELT|nr:PEGA domain-containing protein [Lujinxingia vulgaris]
MRAGMPKRVLQTGLMALVMMTSACASTTLVESQPAGATLILDGERYAGQTPVQIRDLPWVFSTRTYQLSMEGYHPRVVELEASANSESWVTCVCTLGTMWPLVFFGRYPSDVVVRLSPIEAPARAAFTPEPSVNFPL